MFRSQPCIEAATTLRPIPEHLLRTFPLASWAKLCTLSQFLGVPLLAQVVLLVSVVALSTQDQTLSATSTTWPETKATKSTTHAHPTNEHLPTRDVLPQTASAAATKEPPPGRAQRTYKYTWNRSQPLQRRRAWASTYLRIQCDHLEIRNTATNTMNPWSRIHRRRRQSRASKCYRDQRNHQIQARRRQNWLVRCQQYPEQK